MSISKGERIVAQCFGTTAGYAGLVQKIDDAIEKASTDSVKKCDRWEDARGLCAFCGEGWGAHQPDRVSVENLVRRLQAVRSFLVDRKIGAECAGEPCDDLGYQIAMIDIALEKEGMNHVHR
jgi:hypothetical protein